MLEKLLQIEGFDVVKNNKMLFSAIEEMINVILLQAA